MEKENLKNADTANREMTITRELNAPVALVWEVWTNPDHIKNWWGPNGFTNTIHQMDLRPGGVWELTMHGPDGTNYKNKSIFREIVENERIVFEHVSAPKHLTTVTFQAEGNKTQIKWHMLFETPEEFEKVISVFNAREGQKQNLEKLERYLLKQ
jgi:uncharacterized protein YndB with AHSA1/START domain